MTVLGDGDTEGIASFAEPETSGETYIPLGE